MKESMFTLKLEAELHEQFMAEAELAHRPASQLVREFMREFVAKQREARAHDVWFRAEVEQGLREADDPNTVCVANEQVEAEEQAWRAELLKRIGG